MFSWFSYSSIAAAAAEDEEEEEDIMRSEKCWKEPHGRAERPTKKAQQLFFSRTHDVPCIVTHFLERVRNL